MKLHLIYEGATWAQAVNIGIDESKEPGDFLIMDDDVFLREETFSLVEKHYNDADIFGFKLLFPDNRIQHAGGFVDGDAVTHFGYGGRPELYPDPQYVAHVTTSLVYIKRHVIDKLGGMAIDIPGVQMEDVDFSFRALKAGFRILYLPGTAIHLESATKRNIFGTDFENRIKEAHSEIVLRHLNDEPFKQILGGFPKPLEEKVCKA